MAKSQSQTPTSVTSLALPSKSRGRIFCNLCLPPFIAFIVLHNFRVNDICWLLGGHLLLVRCTYVPERVLLPGTMNSIAQFGKSRHRMIGIDLDEIDLYFKTWLYLTEVRSCSFSHQRRSIKSTSDQRRIWRNQNFISTFFIQ